MADELPPFEPVTLDELRRIWVEHPESKFRRMALEIQRYRKVLAEVDSLYQTVHQSYRDATNSELVALHLFKQLMHHERYRLPDSSRYR